MFTKQIKKEEYNTSSSARLSNDFGNDKKKKVRSVNKSKKGT